MTAEFRLSKIALIVRHVLFVCRGRDVGPGVVLFGALFALTGLVLALVVTFEFRRWFSTLALCISTWMLLLFALMMNV